MPVELLGAPCPSATTTGSERDGRREVDLVAVLSGPEERRCLVLCSKRALHANWNWNWNYTIGIKP